MVLPLTKKRREYMKRWYQKNKKRIRKQQKEYEQRPEVKKKLKEYRKKWAEENKERRRWQAHLRAKEYLQRPEVKERRKKYTKEYYKDPKNLERKRKREREYYKIPHNRDRKLRQMRKPEAVKRSVEYKKKRLKVDKDFAVYHRIRLQFINALRKYSKTGKIQKASKYGIDYKAIIEHLKPFPEPLKDYHVDHIIPLSLFDLNNPEEIKWAFAPENLQWLLGPENIRKSNKHIWVKEKD